MTIKAILRDEVEIISCWESGVVDDVVPLISICCITYNHEAYIEDALVGFLNQETQYAYEVLVYDDASSDRTPEIIRQYQQKYPKIIKPIYQSENQYSKGVKPNIIFNFPRAKGAFIALCEGDDYWLSVDKLEVQVAAMLRKKSLISFHSADTRRQNLMTTDRHKYEKENYTLQETFSKGHHFVQTSTIVFDRECLSKFNIDILSSAPVGDVLVRIWCGDENGLDFVKGIKSVYRVQTTNSWSSSTLNDEYKKLLFYSRMLEMLDELIRSESVKSVGSLRFYREIFLNEVFCSFKFGEKSDRFVRLYQLLTGYDLSVPGQRAIWIFMCLVRRFLRRIRRFLRN